MVNFFKPFNKGKVYIDMFLTINMSIMLLVILLWDVLPDKSGLFYIKVISLPLIYLLFIIVVLNVFLLFLVGMGLLIKYILRKNFFIGVISIMKEGEERKRVSNIALNTLFRNKRFNISILILSIIFSVIFEIYIYDSFFHYLLRFSEYLGVFAAVLDALLVGIGAYYFREKKRLYYGIIEVIFGIVLLIHAVMHYLPLASLTNGDILQIPAAIYVIVRGIDNVKKEKQAWIDYAFKYF